MAGKFKTLTLVEEGELDRLRQRQLKDYNPGLKSMISIQDQIENILKDPQIDDEGKYKILTYLQNKFGYLYNMFKLSALPPPQMEVVNAMNDEAALAEDKDDSSQGGSDVEGGDLGNDANLSEVKLPQHYLAKFKKFQDFLNEHRDKIRTNHKNELVLDGVPFPNTSMTDLLRSFYVRNVSMNLMGLTNLIQKLHSLGVDPKIFSHKEATNFFKRLETRESGNFSKSQTGKGKSRPPGKVPRLLRVFRF